mgnify:CR=1 FL=1
MNRRVVVTGMGVVSSLGCQLDSFFDNIKNSSNFLPGHGGIFDRLDSFVMSSISLLIISYFI